jgi:chorismate mutase-like protein
MPNTTPQAASTAEAPPSEDGWPPGLTALRARLDELDDKIHDLLMERAKVVENVARSGKAAAFRPGREAAILRRLLARHKGELPAKTLVRMWREMLAGTTAMQTAVTIAVFDPTQGDAIAAIAREHFGFLTQAIGFSSAEAALNAVRTGTATLAVLPFPTEGAAWWPALTDGRPRLYVIARLPFWAHRPAHVPAADALVVGTAAPDASGADRSFILAPDRTRLANAGLPIQAPYGAVVEVDGMVTEDDARLPAGAIALGGYALPVAGEQA